MNASKLPRFRQERSGLSQSYFHRSTDLVFQMENNALTNESKPSGRNAVMMVPVTEQGDLLLVREYCAGTERYELGFPKGLIDPGETAEAAANREMKEEGRRRTQTYRVKRSGTGSLFLSKMTLFIAQDHNLNNWKVMNLSSVSGSVGL